MRSCLVLLAVLIMHRSAIAQSAMRPVAVDGDAAPGFLGSSIDIASSDQTATNSLPQLTADGRVTFRARVTSTTGGLTTSDSWWMSSEGSYQIVAYVGGNPGIHSVQASQLGRLYAHQDAQRVVVDRGIARFYEWLDQQWVVGLGSGGWPTSVNGVNWFFSQIDRTNLIMPRADLAVFAARLPAQPGSLLPGSNNWGFVWGWQGVYQTLLATGQPFPDGASGQYVVAPDSTDTAETSLGRSLRMNAAGQWAARVAIGGPGTTTQNNVALLRGTLGGGEPLVVLRTGDPAPGWAGEPAMRIALLSRPSINAQGHIAFIAQVVPATGGGTPGFALYADRGAGLELVARSGTPVVPAVATVPDPFITSIFSPAGGAGPAFGVIPPAVIGDDGTVAFMATSTRGEGAFALLGGVVHEIARRDMVLPRSGGRLTVRAFNADGQSQGATGMAIAANGDVVFSAPVTGNYDPRLAQTTFQTHALLSWRLGRGVRVIACQGMLMDEYPGSRNRIITCGLLGDGNNSDGVPTGVGHGSGAAVQVNFARLANDTSPSFNAVMLADLDTFACGIADIAGSGGEPAADGSLDNNDFIVLINRYFSGDLRADYGKVGGEVGFDDRLDNNDFVAFISLFFAGCD